jgi:hypothetical protein
MVAVSIALVAAYRLRGEGSAIVMVVDGVVLGYSGLMALLGVALRERLRLGGEAARSGLVWLAVWSVFGPLPTTLYSVFHCIKMFA